MRSGRGALCLLRQRAAADRPDFKKKKQCYCFGRIQVDLHRPDMTTDAKRKIADDKAYDSINDEDLDIEDAVARPAKVAVCLCPCIM